MYQFTHKYGQKLGDAIAIVGSIPAVGDLTLCAMFRPFDYGGAFAPGGASGTYPEGFAQTLMTFEGHPASPRGVAAYRVDTGNQDGQCEFRVNATGGWSGRIAPLPTRNTTHTAAIVRAGAGAKFWLDGRVIATLTPAALAILLDHIRVGCGFDNGVDRDFFWGQLGQWGLWKRAWSDAEVPVYHSAAGSAVNVNSESMWGQIGFSTTGLEIYLPLVDDADDHSGKNYKTALIGAPAPVVPTAAAAYARIVPGGGDLLQIGLKSIATGKPVRLASFGGGLTITAPAGTPRPIKAQCATGLDFLWVPLDPVGNWERILPDTSAAKVGNWPASYGFDNGLYGNHNPGDFNRFTQSYGNQHVTSSTPSATATWTFTDVPPGTYSVLTIYHASPDRTPTATYTVKDGAATVGSFAVDQRQTRRYDTVAPFNQRAVDGRRTMVLGEVTITTGTTVAITLANTAGSGVLAANMVGLRRIIQPQPAGSILNAPPGWCSTEAGDATALTDIPIGSVSLEEFMPFDAARARTMWRGYNISTPDYQHSNPFYADRMLMASRWEGSGIAVDALGHLTNNPGTATRIFMRQPLHYAYDGTTLPMMKEYGTWRIVYTIINGTPDVVIEVDIDHGEVLGPHSAPTQIGGKLVRTVTIDTRGTIHPGIASLRVKVTRGTARVEVYGPEVPADWNSIFHPCYIDWLKGRGFETVRVDPQGINNYSEVERADMPRKGQASTVFEHTRRMLDVVSVGPVDPVESAKWFPPMNGCVAVLVTTSTPHGLRTGDTPRLYGLSEDGTGWATNGTPNGTAPWPILRPDPRMAVVMSPTTFMLQAQGAPADEVSTVRGQMITLKDTHRVTGSVPLTNGLGIPYEDYIRLVNECGVKSFYFNAPVSASDDFADQFGELAATTLDRDKYLWVALSNETWNTFQGQSVSLVWEHHAKLGPSQGRAWLAHRTNEIANRIKAKFVAAGRPASDVKVVIETLLGVDTPTGQSLGYAHSIGMTVDAIAPATYRWIVPDPGYPPGYGLGYTTDFEAGLAAVSDASAMSVLWINQRYGDRGDVLKHYAAIKAEYGYPNAKTITYEGGQDGLNLWSIERSSRMFRHPMMHRLELAITQFMQDSGLDGECVYQLMYPDGPTTGNHWLTYWMPFEAPGTGDPSEGKNPHDMRAGEGPALFGPAAPSQTGGAHRTWVNRGTPPPVSGSTFALAATTAVALAATCVAATAKPGGFAMAATTSAALASTYRAATPGGDKGWDEVLPEPTDTPGPNPTAREALAWLYARARKEVAQSTKGKGRDDKSEFTSG